ncbi:unnamed protein product [Closterium sp. NIES-65]|nr:unnamed protein product [Closterium sp. NIES-65]
MAPKPYGPVAYLWPYGPARGPLRSPRQVPGGATWKGGAGVAPSAACFGARGGPAAGGEGVRVWGSPGSGPGVAGVRPPSSRPSTSPLFPPLLLLQQFVGEGEGEGEGGRV